MKSCNEQHFCAFLVLGLLQAALCTGFFTEWPQPLRPAIITSMGGPKLFGREIVMAIGQIHNKAVSAENEN